MPLMCQVFPSRRHQLGPRHHAAVLRLSHGGDRAGARYSRLLLKGCRFRLPLRYDRENRTVDCRPGRLGKDNTVLQILSQLGTQVHLVGESNSENIIVVVVLFAVYAKTRRFTVRI